ncbi:hypothetical protein OC834_002118 [Tilletia horrida]|uniref:Cytochrome P450 n=1 Tax=Tilletia horrida TaxID=155126 RepID=A0AAN6G594_9BASI|nr:hypothetical protein OC842_006939 [Tilletia horrida]KAK0527426.1 hypothetical protein OC835_004985 [Tilletia horrida]KAK0533789.1 hypothetical protein OC834_002118 [Tilletia horrida]KAK0562572.1 hypothetical protein OC844_002638 [Tilletia horrida]
MAWSITTVALLAPLALIGIVLVGVSLFMANIVGGMLYRYFIGEYYNNPVRHIPKVKHADGILKTIVMGDFARIKAAAPAAQHIEWMQSLGPVYRYRHAFYVQRVLLADPKAMLWLTTQQNSYKFPKPEHTSAFLAAMIGHGLVASDGDAHKRQRRILAPAFSPACVRELQPSMDMHGAQLVHKLNSILATIEARHAQDVKTLASHGGAAAFHGMPGLIDGETAEDRAITAGLPAGNKPSAVIDMLFWASRVTLNVIGDVGFNYNFDALNKGHSDPVADSCNKAVAACMDVDLFQAISIILSENKGFGWLRNIPTKANITRKKCRDIIDAEARRIVAKGKAEVRAELAQMGTTDKSAFDEGTIAGLGNAKSIFTRMIRANMATDVKDAERLSDHELEQQLITLILAGHETSATGLSWALDLLAKNPSAQEKLRQELLNAPREDIEEHDDHEQPATQPQGSNGHSSIPRSTRGMLNFKDIHALPYLDAVMKEVIRLAPSITSTVRQATEDAIIPLSKGYPKAGSAGKKGETFDSVFIPKGAEIFIPIQVLQASPDIWGEDALEFKPERWFSPPQSALDTQLPNQLFAFLTGPRSCIGQRLAVSEMKILLAHIIYRFRLAEVPGYEFDARQTIVTRAFVKGQEKHGTRMPLILTPV